MIKSHHLEKSYVITNWGALSSIDEGEKEFSIQLSNGENGLKKLSRQDNYPMDSAYYIKELSSEFIKGKGTRYYDRTTQLSIAAAGKVLSKTVVDTLNKERTGVVLGTTMGSIKSISLFGCETLLNERPYLVNPMEFPNTVMNCAASQVAIKFGLKGLNSTVSGGTLASLNALNYAMLALNLGYSDTILVGGVEELSEQTAWGFFHSGLLEQPNFPGLGEGASMFLLEDKETAKKSGRQPVAKVLGCSVSYYPMQDNNYGDLSNIIANNIRELINKVEFNGTFNGMVFSSQIEGTDLYYLEMEGLTKVLGSDIKVYNIKQQIGECYSASGALQVAAFLSYIENLSNNIEYGLITSISNSGMIGCALLGRCKE